MKIIENFIKYLKKRKWGKKISIKLYRNKKG